MELQEPCAIFLTEHVGELNDGAGFLSRLDKQQQEVVRGLGTTQILKKNDTLFTQGEQHGGIWIIESGRIRTFYSGPTGREVTLAYWTTGHFVGGPEVFGGGKHIWSADSLENSEVLYLPGRVIRRLVEEMPQVAISIIEGLVAKGKCYSALIQMFGTRTATERLKHLLIILATHQGREVGDSIVVDRTITYEQLATIVGATRQWVSTTLDNLQSRGVLTLTRHQLQIGSIEALKDMLDLPSTFPESNNEVVNGS
ncbi:MAG: Crp/Fnr family transcriptional regulator [Granulosicoccus sp.]|nr:Crp/Fnr family transcriptional regulator [Granulosicoccus sp.]